MQPMTDNPKSDGGHSDDPRTRLAGERTLLAWIRTGVALMGLGFVVARFGMFLHSWVPLSMSRPPIAPDSRW